MVNMNKVGHKSFKKLSQTFHSNNFFFENMVLFDIETTGLSADTSYLYLIGTIAIQQGELFLTQWFCNDYSEEKELLSSFQTFLSHFDCLIHYGAWYLKSMIARRDHELPEKSVMIREKHVTKDEMYKELNNKKVDVLRAKKELKMFCTYCNMSYTKLMLKAKIYSKRWW